MTRLRQIKKLARILLQRDIAVCGLKNHVYDTDNEVNGPRTSLSHYEVNGPRTSLSHYEVNGSQAFLSHYVVIVTAIILVGPVSLLAGGGLPVGTVPNAAPNVMPESADAVEDVATDAVPADQDEAEHEAFRLAVIVTIVVVVTLFAAILLLTIGRISQRCRHLMRLGKKAAPTEYVDAWSRYRLADDDDPAGRADKEGP